MHTRSLVIGGALLVAALGCRDDTQSPTEPVATSPRAAVTATAALVFWQISAGMGNHTCGVTADSLAYCWGANGNGQLGDGTGTGALPRSLVPVAVAGGHRFREVSAGGNHTCGVRTDYRAYCWGLNINGQLGNGTYYSSTIPVAVTGGLRFRTVSAGVEYSCGMTTEYRVYCWGYDEGKGRLGNPAYQNGFPVNSPVPVVGGLRVRQVSVGLDHTCALTTTNGAYCWGLNNKGQLGDSGKVELSATPVRVAGGHQFRQLDAGGFHTCAVTTTYRAFCWGDGRTGALGNGKTYLSFWPRRVSGELSFERVTAGGNYTCAETTGNRAFCWGNNEYAQLGDGTKTSRLTPVSVSGGLYFSQLTAGGLHTCGRTPAGVAYCWGYNPYGDLGDGTTVLFRVRPARVAGAL